MAHGKVTDKKPKALHLSADFILPTAYLTAFQLGNAINDAAPTALWLENAMGNGESTVTAAAQAEKSAPHTAGMEKKA